MKLMRSSFFFFCRKSRFFFARSSSSIPSHAVFSFFGSVFFRYLCSCATKCSFLCPCSDKTTNSARASRETKQKKKHPFLSMPSKKKKKKKTSQNQKKGKRTCVSLLFLEYSRSACSRACSKNISLCFL